ncbi:MAG: hypothetical protein VKM97_02760 [Cyanobacteriota bacterium]|nr:hypothetical protein [Cyanobacteriota bacterium]
MTASSSWWKAGAERCLQLLPLTLLAACGGSLPAGPGTSPGSARHADLTPLPGPLPVPPEAAAAPPASAPATPTAPAAVPLIPLPTRQQLVAAVPLGRLDPFAPPPRAAAARAAAPIDRPAGFRFTGLVVSGGQAQALVQLGDLSGSLRVGDRGGRSTNLLPAGWSVARIDGRRGVLTLRQGQRTLAIEL